MEVSTRVYQENAAEAQANGASEETEDADDSKGNVKDADFEEK